MEQRKICQEWNPGVNVISCGHIDFYWKTHARKVLLIFGAYGILKYSTIL